MARYQFRIVDGRFRKLDQMEKELNELGEDGWRAVGVAGRRRPVVFLTRNVTQHEKDLRKAQEEAAAPAQDEGNEGKPTDPPVPPAAPRSTMPIRDLIKAEKKLRRKPRPTGPRPLRLAGELVFELPAFTGEDRRVLERALEVLRTPGAGQVKGTRDDQRRRAAADMGQRRRHHVDPMRPRLAHRLAADLFAYVDEHREVLERAIEVLRAGPDAQGRR